VGGVLYAVFIAHTGWDGAHEEMVIENLRSLPVGKQQLVSVPALAAVHATGLANLVDVL
jgi:hypothetical protein